MPTFTQADVLKDASVILSDISFTRWTASMLNGFLNEAIRTIALQKPNSVEKTVPLPMEVGVRQKVSDPFFALIRALRNETGPAITEVTRELMDASVPGWADPTIYPESGIVEHVIFDVAEPEAFLVYPYQTGGTNIIAVVASMPNPLADGSNPTDINTFTATVPMADIYRTPIVDYVLYRAFTIDQAFPGAQGRAQTHYAMFAAALGIKFKAEAVASPKTTFAPPETRVSAGQ